MGDLGPPDGRAHEGGYRIANRARRPTSLGGLLGPARRARHPTPLEGLLGPARRARQPTPLGGLLGPMDRCVRVVGMRSMHSRSFVALAQNTFVESGVGCMPVESAAMSGVESAALPGVGSAAMPEVESAAMSGVESAAMPEAESAAMPGVVESSRFPVFFRTAASERAERRNARRRR